MMKKKTHDKPKFEVKKRTPKEKPDYFKNLTPFTHPVAEILNFPADAGAPEEKPDFPSSAPESIVEMQTDVSLRPLAETISDTTSAVPQIENLNSASGLDSSPLADSNKPASLLAPLVKKSVKGASKLAPLKKTASRTEIQMLADLRQSKGKRVQIAIRIRPHVKQAIDVFTAKQGISQQDFFELSASSFIENYNKKLADLRLKSASLLAHDDRRLLWETTHCIINLYLHYNLIFNSNTKWTTRDDDAAKPYNEVDLRIIELGIIQTHFNRGFRSGKINSFQYYTNQIDEMKILNFNEDTLDAMLGINRRRWEQASGKTIDLSFLGEKSSPEPNKTEAKTETADL